MLVRNLNELTTKLPSYPSAILKSNDLTTPVSFYPSVLDHPHTKLLLYNYLSYKILVFADIECWVDVKAFQKQKGWSNFDWKRRLDASNWD